MHDPTTVDQQGPDIGDNYRSAIFYADQTKEKLAKASLAEVDAAHTFHDKIVTQSSPPPNSTTPKTTTSTTSKPTAAPATTG